MKLIPNFQLETSTIYCTFDPAIDHTKTNLRDYVRQRDPKILVFKQGMKPTVFHVRNINNALVNGILKSMERMGATDAYEWFFQHGVEKIENIQEINVSREVTLMKDGMDIWEPTGVMEMDGIKVKHITDEEMKLFHYATIQEIGSYIQKKTSSPKGKEPLYPVLASSNELIMAVRH